MLRVAKGGYVSRKGHPEDMAKELGNRSAILGDVSGSPRKNPQQSKMIKLICVGCGKEATEGSYKHPYCKECFKRVWNNDYDKYMDWLHKEHEKEGMLISKEAKESILFMAIGSIVSFVLSVGFILLGKVIY